jgi:hypothetical protein
MTTVAAIVQLQGEETLAGTDVLMGASYMVADDVSGHSKPMSVYGIACPIGDRSVWKANIIAGIIADAALQGFTLTSDKVFWLTLEPGDFKYPEMVAAWTKDITKTNIGTTAVNVYTGANGEAQSVDFSSFKQARFVAFGNKIGTGNLTMRMVDVTNAANTIDITYTGAAGEFVQDGGWANLPAWAVGEKFVKPAAFSSVSTDDPVFRQFLLYLR